MNTTLISPNTTNLYSIFQNLTNGNTLMPTLAQVNAGMTKIFGPGPYSTIPVNPIDICGTWNVFTQNPTSNYYVSVSPYSTINTPTLVSGNNNIVSTVAGLTTTAAMVKDLVVTDMSSALIHGFLSLQKPQNYIVYSPFPASSVTDPAFLPVAAVGISLGANSINFITFPNGTESVWTLVQPLNANNVSIYNALQLNNGMGVATTQLSPGSPAAVAASLNITPANLQNMYSTAANLASGSTTIPASAAFNWSWNAANNIVPGAATQNTIATAIPQQQTAAAMMMGANNTNLNALRNTTSIASNAGVVPAATVTHLRTVGYIAPPSSLIKHDHGIDENKYHPKCSCPDCHHIRTHRK